jgi:hypothetical protein
MHLFSSPLKSPLVGAFVVLLHEALEYEMSRFESGREVDATDLLRWYAQWRKRVKQQFGAAATWTDKDAAKGYREGWAFLDSTGGSMEGFQIIQKIDDEDILPDDCTALEHIYERARQGSVLHVKALLCDGQPSRQ